jgi:uncharacterized protein YlxW (UPF0749 family)
MKKHFFTPSTVTLLTFFIASIFLGWIATAQIRVLNERVQLENLDYNQLSALYFDISTEITDLRRQVADINERIEIYSSEERNRGEIIKQLKEELATLEVLNGTSSLIGEGVQIRLDDRRSSLSTQDIIDLINELKAAGAVAIGLNGIRITERSGFMIYEGELYVSERKLNKPYLFEVIGDPDVLFSSLNMPGGVVSALKSVPGVEVHIEKKKEVILPPVERLYR